MLRCIWGQTHIVGGKHKLPMITVPDRIENFQCGWNEHLCCPELECVICICDKCTNNLDGIIVNEINWTESETKSSDYGSKGEDSSIYSLQKLTASPKGGDGDNDNDSILDSNDIHRPSGSTTDRGEFGNFLTHDIPDAFGYHYDDSHAGRDNYSDDLYIPTTDAGDPVFDIEKYDKWRKTRCVKILGHIILNFVGTLLKIQRHKLKQ